MRNFVSKKDVSCFSVCCNTLKTTARPPLDPALIKNHFLKLCVHNEEVPICIYKRQAY